MGGVPLVANFEAEDFIFDTDGASGRFSGMVKSFPLPNHLLSSH